MADTALKLFIGLNRVVNAIHRAADPVLSLHGLTRGQFAVLEALYHKGELSVGEVMDLVLTTTGNIPVIVNNLERRGYLTRRRDEADKRRILLSISTDGRQLVSLAFPENAAVIKDKFAGLTPAEQKQLSGLLKKLGGQHEKNH